MHEDLENSAGERKREINTKARRGNKKIKNDFTQLGRVKSRSRKILNEKEKTQENMMLFQEGE